MLPYNCSKKYLICALALAAASSAAQAANTYRFKVFAPGIVATQLAPATPPTAPTPPAPPRDYAKLVSGPPSFNIASDGLSATHLGYKGQGDVIANVGLSSGKWYWEVRRDAGLGYVAIGIGPTWASANWSGWGDAPTHSAYGIAYMAGVGFGAHGPDIKREPFSSDSGDVLGFALDMDTGIFRVFHNCVERGVWSGWAGAVRHPVIASGGGTAGGTLTANFGASPFACPVPEGYNAGVWAP